VKCIAQSQHSGHMRRGINAHEAGSSRSTRPMTANGPMLARRCQCDIVTHAFPQGAMTTRSTPAFFISRSMSSSVIAGTVRTALTGMNNRWPWPLGLSAAQI
jgi:hypothetical protein